MIKNFDLATEDQAKKTEKKHGMWHIFAALKYSMSGLRIALRETAIRQEIVLSVVHFVGIAVVNMPISVKMILTAQLGLLLTTELLNTAIESTVDIASPSRNELAKNAKDLGSAAVFCALAFLTGGWVYALLGVMP